MDNKSNEINLSALKEPLERICAACDSRETDECSEPGCLVGFAVKVLGFASQRGVLDIPGAENLVPRDDFKPYYAETVAPALAETCKQCRECRDNHSPDCIISLVRCCLESAVLTENIDYPGSVFMYLAMVREQNSELASRIASNMKK